MQTILMASSVDRYEPGGVQAVMDGLGQRLDAAGVRVIDVHSRPVSRMPLADRRWARPAVARAARQARRARLAWLLLRHRPCVVNYHFATGDAAFFLRLRRLFGYRLVVSAHGSDVLRPERTMQARLQRVLSGADAVTTVSRDLQQAVLNTPGVMAERVHLIPNGIDTAYWSPAPSGRSHAQDMPARLVAIGRLDPVKGFDLLLEALGILRARGLYPELVLIGDGPARADLEAQAERLGLGGQVRFRGFLTPAEVRESFRAAHVFVMSSRSEGMPLALLEAMACGLAPVAARVGGVPEILRAGGGRLVPPESTQELADALGSLLGAPDEIAALGARARQRAQDFSSTSVDGAYLRAFRLSVAPAAGGGAEQDRTAGTPRQNAKTESP